MVSQSSLALLPSWSESMLSTSRGLILMAKRSFSLPPIALWFWSFLSLRLEHLRRRMLWLLLPCLQLSASSRRFFFSSASLAFFSASSLRSLSSSSFFCWANFFSCSALISLRLACFSLSLFNSSSSLPRCLRHSLMYSLSCSSSSPFCFLALRLLLGFAAIFLELVHFGCEDCLRCCSGVDTVGLDGNENVAVVLEEVGCVQSHDACLVRLGHVGEDDIYHPNEHSVSLRLPGVLHDWHNIWPSLGHISEISSRPVREFYSI